MDQVIIITGLCILMIACVLAGIWYDDPCNKSEDSQSEDSQSEDSIKVCPVCNTPMEYRYASGIDRYNQECEADWDECPKCGHCE